MAASRFCSTSSHAPATYKTPSAWLRLIAMGPHWSCKALFSGPPASRMHKKVAWVESRQKNHEIMQGIDVCFITRLYISNAAEDSDIVWGSVLGLTSAVCAAALVDGQECGVLRQHRKQVHQLDNVVRQHILVVVHVCRNQIPFCDDTQPLHQQNCSALHTVCPSLHNVLECYRSRGTKIAA